ncbi:MAG TPA: hypothetical protein VMC03_21005 [Streptosporangiaceae bacterium]|nr:hypothetical protein [Streptosporangiaceae bacterium]
MDDSLDSDEEQTTISYRAVGPGLPVVTHSGKQFGVVEHVLEVPDLDLFDGIVVYTGSGFVGANMRHERLARFEMLRIGQLRGWLRFVDADQVAAITPGYVKCSFEMDQVANLPVPNGPPVLHPDMAQEDRVSSAQRNAFTGYYAQWFRRPRWLRK